MNGITLASRQRTKVLIVDDTAANLRLLKRILSEQGYMVHAANAGEAALQFMESTVPDIVLLDVMMPDMDGYEVCRRIKADERLRDVPVIFISAMDAAWDKVKAFTAGGVDYVVKPIEETELLARLETHLALCGLRRHLEQRVEERTAELCKAREALLENQRLLKAIIDTSNAVITVKDLDGRYLLVNRRFQDLFGKPGADLCGLTDADIFPADAAQRLRELDRKSTDSGDAVEAEETLPAGRQQRTYVSLRSPLRDANGKVHAVCGIATDITERALEEATLRELNQMLESRLSQRLASGVE